MEIRFTVVRIAGAFPSDSGTILRFVGEKTNGPPASGQAVRLSHFMSGADGYSVRPAFRVRKGKGRPSSDKYREVIAKRDGRLLRIVNNGYDVAHLSMGYDGVKSKKVCDTGFEVANDIIDICAKLYAEPVCA